MLAVYDEKLATAISQAPFVAVQADETTDVACVSQCVIVRNCASVHHWRERHSGEISLFLPVVGQNCGGPRKTSEGKARAT